MTKSVHGINYLERQLRLVREAMEREDELSESTLRTVRTRFGGTPNMLTTRLEELRDYRLKNPDGLEASGLFLKHQQMVGKFLDQESSYLAGRRMRARRRQRCRLRRYWTRLCVMKRSWNGCNGSGWVRRCRHHWP